MSLQEVNSPAKIEESIAEGLKAPPQLLGVGYSQKEVLKARDTNRLLRVNIEIAENKCNLRCIYCYSFNNDHKKSYSSLTEEDIRNVMVQAKDLGARSVVFTGGGEPLLNKKRFFSFVSFARRQGLIPTVFTNGTCIDGKMAHELDSHGVTVITKLNSLNQPEITNRLSGQPWAYGRMWRGVQNLLKTGLAERGQLGLETVITKDNYAEIVEMWRWAREHRVVPYFELAKIQGRARRFASALEISPSQAHALFESLLRIDREEFKYDWVPTPPMPGAHCHRIYCGCYVTAAGNVQPCSGVAVTFGNIRRQKLVDIINKPTFRKLRYVERNIGGKCRTCQYLGLCYGCRGNAYQITGDPFAGDPGCWFTANSSRGSIQGAPKR